MERDKSEWVNSVANEIYKRCVSNQSQKEFIKEEKECVQRLVAKFTQFAKFHDEMFKSIN